MPVTCNRSHLYLYDTSWQATVNYCEGLKALNLPLVMSLSSYLIPVGYPVVLRIFECSNRVLCDVTIIRQ